MGETVECGQFNHELSSLQGGDVLIVVGQTDGAGTAYYELLVTEGIPEGGQVCVRMMRAGPDLGTNRAAAGALLRHARLAILGTCVEFSTDCQTGNDRPVGDIGSSIMNGTRICFGALTGNGRLVTEPLVEAELFSASRLQTQLV